MSVWKWSQTAATNATADSTVNWQEGQAGRTVNNSARAMMAAVAKWRDDISGKLVTAGTSTAYTLTTNQSLTALTDGFMVGFELDETCGAAPTLNVDSLGAVDLIPFTGGTFAAGALKAGGKYVATYDSSASAWVVNGMFITGLGSGGTGAELSDPGADRVMFWDDSAGAVTWLTAGTGLNITDTTLTLNHLGVQNLADPGADRIAFWDDTATSFQWLSPASGLAITGTSLGFNIDGMDELTLPAPTTDYAVVWDASASDHKKLKLSKTGAMVLLNTMTASSSTTLTDTTSLTADFDLYLIVFENIRPATDGVDFYVRVSTDGGSNYKTTGYSSSAFGWVTSTASATLTTAITPTCSSLDVGNGTNEGLSGHMYVTAPSSTSLSAKFWGQTIAMQSASTPTGAVFVGAYETAGAAVNALQFLMSSGNIASGSIHVYGVAN